MSQLHRRLALAGICLSTAAVTLLSAAAANAAAPDVNPVQAAAGWLSTQFVDGTHLPTPDGDHFESKYGSSYFANYGENADVLFGLAAAKAGRTKIDTALQYLVDNIEGYADISNSDGYGPYDGSVGKLALAAIVAGKDPVAVGGHDLMAVLAADECPSTGKTGAGTDCTPGSAANIFSSISESFVVLAEARVGGTSAPTPAALSYLLSLQCTDGGFTDGTTACGAGAADLDATSYAIMALTAAGGHSSELDDAVAWLTGQQKSGGYWVSQDVPNANSTALAVAALSGAGVSGTDADVSSGRTWLRAQQIGPGKPGAGAFRYGGAFVPTTTAATSPSVLATAQALTALVDHGGLATLTAKGSTSGVSLYAPAAKLSSGTVIAGHEQTVTADGFAAGETVTAVLHSKAVQVGSSKADASGAVKITYPVPASIGAGAHSVVLTGASSALTVSRPFTVTAPAAATTPAATSATVPATVGRTPAATNPIANTGQDSRKLVELGVLGALAVALGTGFVLVGRRRSH